MTVMVGAGLVVAILVGLSVRRLFKAHMATFDNIDATGVRFYLNMLIENGLDGSFLFVDDMTSQRFVQFRKYRTRAGRAGIECHFPSAAWSEPYFPAVGQLVEARGMELEEVTAAGPSCGRFIRVDFANDVDSATEFTTDVFTRVFALPNLKVRVRGHGISMRQNSDQKPDLTADARR